MLCEKYFTNEIKFLIIQFLLKSVKFYFEYDLLFKNYVLIIVEYLCNFLIFS